MIQLVPTFEGSISTVPPKEVAILFTDLKKSSELWAKHPGQMSKAIDAHYEQIDGIVSDHDGFIVKTIGDAFMCCFKSLRDAVEAAVKIQQDKPVKAAGNELIMRIGICYGPTIIKKIKVQGADMKDYFGNTVNSASRLETELSDPGGFAFASIPEIGDMDAIRDVIGDFKVSEVHFGSGEIRKRIRSSRLLTDAHVMNKSAADLKGAEIEIAYRVRF